MTPELKLVIDACRRTFDGHCAPDVAGPVDWARFLRLARFHRVQGLVWQSLAHFSPAFPAEIAQALASDAQAIAAASLSSAIASRDLLSVFKTAGMPILFVKGLTLGVLAYGSSATKSAVDIDVLVAERDIAAIGLLLDKAGFRVHVPADTARLAGWHRLRKESTWLAADAPLQLDLHTRLSDNRRLIPSIGLDSPQQYVDVGNGISLPTLADEELFAYLTVHGASSAWFRLKWITDLAALLHRRGGEVERLYRRAVELGAGRAPAQALLLADSLYGSLARHPRLSRELAQPAPNRLLFRAALHQLSGEREPVEPTRRRLGTLTIHWTQLLLQSGAMFKLSEIVRQARTALH